VEPDSKNGNPMSRIGRLGENWPWFFGKFANPADLKRTFWGESRVKHGTVDRYSKDWEDNEPDPAAP